MESEAKRCGQRGHIMATKWPYKTAESIYCWTCARWVNRNAPKGAGWTKRNLSKDMGRA